MLQIICIVILCYLGYDYWIKKSDRCTNTLLIINNSILEHSEQKVIISYLNNQYDITNFIKFHPGGKEIIYKNIDANIEDIMKEYKHSTCAYKLLEKYKIN